MYGSKLTKKNAAEKKLFNDQIETARTMGTKAFYDGIKCIHHNAPFRQFLKETGYPMGAESNKIMDEYNKAYMKACHEEANKELVAAGFYDIAK